MSMDKCVLNRDHHDWAEERVVSWAAEATGKCRAVFMGFGFVTNLLCNKWINFHKHEREKTLPLSVLPLTPNSTEPTWKAATREVGAQHLQHLYPAGLTHARQPQERAHMSFLLSRVARSQDLWDRSRGRRAEASTLHCSNV